MPSSPRFATSGPRPVVSHPPTRAWLGAPCLLVLALAGCPVVDVHEPGPPALDPLPARTAHATVVVTGAAEPGARIRVRRQPEIAANATPALGEASAASGRFSVTLPLEPDTVHTVEVLAIARNGRASAPASFTIERAAPKAVGINLLLEESRPVVRTGGATLGAIAQLLFEEPDTVDGRPVTFRLTLGDGSQRTFESAADATGLARLLVPGLRHEGSGQLTAEVREGNARYEDTQAFAILAGAPASARVDLVPVEGGLPVTSIQAGTWFAAKVEARDAGDNVVPARWNLAVEPLEGAQLVGGAVRFREAGTFDIKATVAVQGAALVATTRVQVSGTAPAEGIASIRASVPAEARSGEPLAYDALLVDGSGRPVVAALTLETDDPAVPSAQASGYVTLRRAGLTRLAFSVTRGSVTTRSSDFFVAVQPGAPTALTARLDGSAAPLPAGSGAAEKLAVPGQELALSVEAQDGVGNLFVPDALTLSLPERVWRVGSTLVAPKEPGTYVVGLSIPGTNVRTAVAFTVAPQPASRVVLACPTNTTAGVAFTCTASVTDAAGLPVTVALNWSLQPPTAGTVAAGRVQLDVAGSARVVASVTGTAVQASQSVTVAAAAPQSIALALLNDPVEAGTDLVFQATVTDAFGNRVTPPLDVSSTAPDAIATQARLTNLARPGTYRLVVRTAPTGGNGGLLASSAFTVSAAAPQALQLTLDRNVALSGQSVQATWRLLDTFGNAAGTPSDIQLRVDGVVPDQLSVRLAGDRLTVRPAGAHVVSVHRGDLSASTVLTISPAPDLVPPEVSLELPTLAANSALRPNSTATVTVRGRDDRLLTGLRLRVTGPGAGDVFDRSVDLPPGAQDGFTSFTVPVANLRLGTMQFTASATDTAGLTTSRTASLTVDLHAGALTMATGTAQSIWIDPRLTRPRSLAPVSNGLWVRSEGQPGNADGISRLVFVAGGTMTERGRFDAFPTVAGLAVAPTAGVPTLFARNRGSADDVVLLRWPAGAPAPQYVTVPGLAPTLADGLPRDLVRHATSGLAYAVESGSGTGSTPRGRLFSTPVPTTGSVDGLSVARFTAIDHAFEKACVAADVAVPTELFVVAKRYAGASTFIGLYRISGLTGAGHVQAGSTLSTQFEEPILDAGRPVSYGGCAVVPGTPARVAFTRWIDDPGPVSGTVRTVPASCTGTCTTATTVAAGTTPFPLASLDALAWDGTGLVVAEGTAGRLFKLSGF